MIVADANLIIYRFVSGPLTAQADEIVRKDPNWRTVPLWRFEFANALATMMRNSLITEIAAFTAIDRVVTEMTLREIAVPMDQAVKTASKYSISAYDAQYVALAEKLNVVCVTADGPLARKVPSRVKLFAEFLTTT